MAKLNPAQVAVIEADPRVIALAKSRGPTGSVRTEELIEFGYDVPPHTKFALTVKGKGFRNRGGDKIGFVYTDES